MARNDPQFNLRISQELKDRLDIEAKKAGRSITQEIIKRLEKSLSEEDALLPYKTEVQKELNREVRADEQYVVDAVAILTKAFDDLKNLEIENKKDIQS